MTPAEVRAMTAAEYLAFLAVLEEEDDMRRAMEKRRQRTRRG